MSQPRSPRPASVEDAAERAGLSDEHAFRLAEETVNQAIGVRIDESSAARIRARLAQLATSRCVSPWTLVHDHQARNTVDAALVEAATNQESWWFRDAHQMAALADVLRQAGDVGTVWCAGCANGQEPYSLAMMFTELGLPRWRVLATDVSVTALARTKEATYASRELRGLSPARRQQFLRPDGAGWKVTEEVRLRVSVSYHNLAKDGPPFAGRWPVVFCRNVLMYLDEGARRAAMDGLLSAVMPGGWLFLGTAESLWRLQPGFQLSPAGRVMVNRRTGYPANQDRRVPLAGPQPAAAPAAAPDVSPVEDPTQRPAPSPALSSAETTGSSATGDLARLRRRGLAALGEGELDQAIEELRKVAYLSASDAVDHFQLGAALEEAGYTQAARRAYRTALATISTTDPERLHAALEGYAAGSLHELLEDKVGRT